MNCSTRDTTLLDFYVMTLAETLFHFFAMYIIFYFSSRNFVRKADS